MTLTVQRCWSSRCPSLWGLVCRRGWGRRTPCRRSRSSSCWWWRPRRRSRSPAPACTTPPAPGSQTSPWWHQSTVTVCHQYVTAVLKAVTVCHSCHSCHIICHQFVTVSLVWGSLGVTAFTAVLQAVTSILSQCVSDMRVTASESGMILCVLSSHWLGAEVTALTSGPMRGQDYHENTNQRPDSSLVATWVYLRKQNSATLTNSDGISVSLVSMTTTGFYSLCSSLCVLFMIKR